MRRHQRQRDRGRRSSGTMILIAAVAAAIAMGVCGCGGSASAGPRGSHGLAQRTLSSGAQASGGSASSTPAPCPRSSLGALCPIGGHNRHIYVVGDSVMLGIVDDLPPALKGWHTTMDCVGSRRLPEEIPALRQKAKAHGLGAVVVIQLGNDYIAGEDGTFASQIRQTMHILRHERRVIWVTVATHSSLFTDSADTHEREGIDRAIFAAAKRYPTIRIADWQPISDSHPGYTYDGLHLTLSGRAAMTKLLAHTVGPPPGRPHDKPA